uniref:Uncharacterized protein n=1 Tax=viral metagenome TaxID=1070528 RepID=A0A6M3ITK4_9ZZZZ
MKEILDAEMLQGFKEFVGNIQWVFLFLFIFLTWALNLYRKRSKPATTKFGKFWVGIPTGWKVLAFGLIIAILYMWLAGMTSKESFLPMLITITFGMVAWKLGLSKIAEKLEKKLGLTKESG